MQQKTSDIIQAVVWSIIVLVSLMGLGLLSISNA